MTTGLDPSRIVEVDVLSAPLTVAGRNFGNLLLLGDSDVIDATERIRDYTGIDAIASDFGTTSPEYLAAIPYFSQLPQPTLLKIGRWVSTASEAVLHGGALNASQLSLANFTGITSGGFTISVNGTSQPLTGLDFHAQTNLNGVASVITTALSGAICTWDAAIGRFDIKTTATGAGTPASGTLTFNTLPANLDGVNIAGTTITFVTSGATEGQINIADSAIAQATALAAYVAANPIVGVIVTSVSNVATVAAVTVGTAGNSLVLTKTSTHITASGSGTLSGGVNGAIISYATAPSSGVDVSALFQFTSTTAQSPIAGQNAETASQAVALMADKSVDWYGLYICSGSLTDDSAVLVASLVEALAPSRIYGATTQNADTLVSTDTACLAYRLEQGGYRRTFCFYSSSNPYAAMSLFGRAFTVNFSGINTTITLKFKQAPGITAETLTASQADSLEAKNCNVFVNYNNGASIIEQGVMSNGLFVDEVHGYDWLQNALQVGRFNVLYQAPGKVPQTDSGMNSLTASDAQVLDQAVRNGFIAPNQWTADIEFGELKTGDFLPTGYYIYSLPVRDQLQSDREARKATTTQIAVKLAGAIHSCVVQVFGNR